MSLYRGEHIPVPLTNRVKRDYDTLRFLSLSWISNKDLFVKGIS